MVLRSVESGDVLTPGVFPTTSAAQRVGAALEPRGERLRLLGLGLSSGDAQELLLDEAQSQDVIYRTLEMQVALEAGGRILGYEPLGKYERELHGWRCCTALADGDPDLGVRANAEGLVDSRDDAERLASYAAEHGEHGTWLPWLIVEYPWPMSS